jgi:hypothetical protein
MSRPHESIDDPISPHYLLALSKAYIFTSGLMIRELCPPSPNSARQIHIRCTQQRCDFAQTINITNISISNCVDHYTAKHGGIPLSAKPTSKSIVVDTGSHKRISKSGPEDGRMLNTPQADFGFEEYKRLLLRFLIDCDIPLAIVDSPCFVDLMTYCNP